MSPIRCLTLSVVVLLAACQSPPEEPTTLDPPVVPVVVEEARAEAPAPTIVEVAPAAPSEPAPSQVSITADGFSPKAQNPANELAISFRWGEPSQVGPWQLTIADGLNRAVRAISGEKAAPGILWNGRDDSGNLVDQGSYTATLAWTTLEGQASVTAPSAAFWVDIVPPSGTITVMPQPFRLVAPDVIVNPERLVSLRLNLVSGGTGWATWRLLVLHPDGRLFRDFISEEHRENLVVWDGRALNNAQLESGTTYQLQAEVFSRYGNRGLAVAGLDVASLDVVATLAPEPVAPELAVSEPTASEPAAPAPPPFEVSLELDGRLLAALPVWFGPNTADLESVSPAISSVNRSSLSELARLLSQAPDGRVTIVGHANQVLYQVPAKAAYEQKETLLPLSLERAEAVKRALIVLGTQTLELNTEGLGALRPLVPFDDAANRWKNRRVVIELVTEPKLSMAP